MILTVPTHTHTHTQVIYGVVTEARTCQSLQYKGLSLISKADASGGAV
jgi:hypothetical protein